MTDALVVGAGAQARYVAAGLRLTGSHRLLGFIDTFGNPAIWGTEIDGVPVLGDLNLLGHHPPRPDLRVVTAIADLAVKRRVVAQLEEAGYAFFSCVHPKAIVAAGVPIGAGCIVNAGAIIETGTRVGNHVIVHAGAVLEHDNMLADFVNIGPGVNTAGRVRFDEGAIAYTGATIIPGRRVGTGAVVGAGAVVLSDIPDGETWVGVPARPIRGA